MKNLKTPLIAVIGAGQCDENLYSVAQSAGRELARNKFNIICGGLGGIMEAACKGAKEFDATTIGILPGNDPAEANFYVDIALATGMGIARNIIIIRSAAAVLAVNGGFGTLSELAFALQLGKFIVGIGTWNVSEQIVAAKNSDDAVELIKNYLASL